MLGVGSRVQGVGCRVWVYPLHEVDEALVVDARVVGHEGRVHPEPRLCEGLRLRDEGWGDWVEG